jgi:hypothetical protein
VGVQLHTFFDLGTRWRRVVSFTFRPLYPQGKRPWYSLERRLGGLQPLPGLEPPIIQPAAELYEYTTELPRLSVMNGYKVNEVSRTARKYKQKELVLVTKSKSKMTAVSESRVALHARFAMIEWTRIQDHTHTFFPCIFPILVMAYEVCKFSYSNRRNFNLFLTMKLQKETTLCWLNVVVT